MSGGTQGTLERFGVIFDVMTELVSRINRGMGEDDVLVDMH
jgi:hypothetical protein